MTLRLKAALVVALILVVLVAGEIISGAYLSGTAHVVFEVALGFVAVGLALYMLDHWIFARLDRLAREVRRAGGGGDLGQRVEMPGNDEITGIAESLNGTMAALQMTAEDLVESEGRFHTVTESAKDAVFIVDGAGDIAYWNAAASVIFGRTAQAAQGASVGALIIPEEVAETYFEYFATARHIGGVTFESVARKPDGSRFPVEISVSAAEFDDQPALVCIARDISERTNIRLIEHMANHDPLTDLPNRNLLSDRMGQAIAMAKRSGGYVAVLFVDLDHFKQVNDLLGHIAGDRLLTEVKDRLLSAVRESDTVARIGGDEFAVVGMHLSKPREAAKMAEGILASLGRPIEMDGHEFLITPSIGISIFPSPEAGVDATPDTLVSQADLAMYAAKKRGRNTYEFFGPEMSERTHRRMAVAKDLKVAIEQGEFVLHFQPQVRMVDGAVVGAEALLRWNHPTRGLVSPYEFIPIAEETGEIVPIGAWVLREALRACESWDAAGLPAIRVAVNLAPLQLSKGDIIASVLGALKDSGLPSSRLQLEMTETVLMDQVDGAMSKLEHLRDFGVLLAMDDFGTGHSSLSRLRRLPVEEIKIDRSFVTGMGDNEESDEIVKAIIGLGKVLHRSVLAEGAETEYEVARLRTYGCDLVQGYYLSRPLPQKEFIEWVKTNQGVAWLPVTASHHGE